MAHHQWVQIASSLNQGFVVAAQGQGQRDKIVLHKKEDQNQNQWWRWVEVKDGWGYLENKTGFVLDVSNGNQANGAEMWLWEKNGTDAQMWKVHPASGEIQSKFGRFLDLSGGKVEQNNKIHNWDRNGTPAQKWHFLEEWYHIVPFELNNGLALTIRPGESAALHDKKGGPNQLFRIVLEGKDGWISLISKAGLALDVKNGDAREGQPMQGFQPNQTKAQLFKITAKGELESQLGEKWVVDVKGSGKSDNTPVHLWSRNGTAAQKWQFQRHG